MKIETLNELCSYIPTKTPERLLIDSELNKLITDGTFQKILNSQCERLNHVTQPKSYPYFSQALKILVPYFEIWLSSGNFNENFKEAWTVTIDTATSNIVKEYPGYSKVDVRRYIVFWIVMYTLISASTGAEPKINLNYKWLTERNFSD